MREQYFKKENIFRLMPRSKKKGMEAAVLQAALEGLELRKKQVEEKLAAVKSMLGSPVKAPAAGRAAPKPKRTLSAAARKRISKAQKRRWAALKAKAAAKPAKRASKKTAVTAKQGE